MGCSPLESSAHEHTFASFWVTNDEYHWHPSTCGHDVKGDEGRHEFTSETNENGDTVYTCSICHYSYSDGNNDDKDTYTVTWENYDGTILEVDEGVPYGATPAYDGDTPTKESDGRYNYAFAGWAPELEPVTKDATYTATFSGEEITYTVTWENYDGTILEVDDGVPYGATPAYDGATPTKESDGRYNYAFAGWAPEIEPVTKDATYTATFSGEEITYTIDFDLDGGTSPSYRGSIEVTAFSKDIFFFDCVKEDWQFRGWEYNGEKIFDEKGNQLKNVTLADDMVFKAIYSQTVKLAITTNMPEAGTITGEGEYPYNTYVDVSASPYQGYEFAGWYYQNTLLSNEENYKYMMWDIDITLEARFEKGDFNLRIYTNNEDYGLVLLKSNSVIDDYLPECAALKEYGSEVTIAAYSKSDVRFLGWYDENNDLVTTNAVYTFVMPNHDYALEAKWNYFTINYNLNGGTNDPDNPDHYTIDSTVYLRNPTKVGYEFIGWEHNGEIIDTIDVNLMQGITLEAIWSPYEYEIKEDDDGKYAVIIGYDDSITDVIIPENIILSGEDIPVKAIGSKAFYNNDTITSITIHDSVTTIGSSAFEGCSNLTTATISENSQLTSIGSSAFEGCSSLTSIYIPDSVTTIGSSAFKGCYNLTTAAISGNSQLTSIGSGAFSYCYSLTSSIYIPDSVTTIGSSAFAFCSNLTIYCAASSKPIGWSSYWNDSDRPVIWNSYKGIHGNLDGLEYTAYHDNEGNPYIAITGYNGSDDDVVIPEYIEVNGEQIAVKEINDKAFYDNEAIISVTIPDSVTTIGSYAFEGCSSLTSIYIPDSVTTIGSTTIDSSAFGGCSNLTIYCEATSGSGGWSSNWNDSDRPVVWSSNGQYGEYSGFIYGVCTDSEGNPYITIAGYTGSSTNVVIPSSINVDGEDIPVKAIASNAFRNNDTITSVIIPNSVTIIGNFAFRSCSNLTIYCEASSEPSGWSSYWNDSDRPVIWNSYKGIHGNLDGLEYTANHDAEGNPYIAITGYNGSDDDVVIPEYIEVNGEQIAVKEINDKAFCDNEAIISVTIPDSVTSIGYRAFRYCSSLTSIYIPDSVTTIGSSAFEGCSNLTIYCEATSGPGGWDSSWNSSDRSVVWNCTYDEYLEAIA